MISNSQIREKARKILGKELFSASWLYPIVIVLVVGTIISFLSATGIGAFVVIGILSIASTNYYLSRVRGTIEAKDLNATINGVQKNFTNSLIAGILCSLFVTLGTVFLIIPGIIVALSLSLVYYIINDHPEMSAMDALKESNRLMKGKKMKLFNLYLSFIGWSIVGSLVLGIGTLWVTVYLDTSLAIFYEEILAEDALSSQENPEEAKQREQDKINNSTSW